MIPPYMPANPSRCSVPGLCSSVERRHDAFEGHGSHDRNAADSGRKDPHFDDDRGRHNNSSGDTHKNHGGDDVERLRHKVGPGHVGPFTQGDDRDRMGRPDHHADGHRDPPSFDGGMNGPDHDVKHGVIPQVGGRPDPPKPGKSPLPPPPPPPAPKPSPTLKSTTVPKPTFRSLINIIQPAPSSASPTVLTPTSSVSSVSPYRALDPSLSSSASTPTLISDVPLSSSPTTETKTESRISHNAQTSSSAAASIDPKAASNLQAPEKHLPAGSIGGIAVVGVVASALVLLFLIWLCRRKKSRFTGSYGLLGKNVDVKSNNSDVVPFENDGSMTATRTRHLSKPPMSMSPRYEQWSIMMPFAARYSASDLESSSPRSTMSSVPPPYFENSRQPVALGDVKLQPDQGL